jgi:hypothetical protein
LGDGFAAGFGVRGIRICFRCRIRFNGFAAVLVFLLVGVWIWMGAIGYDFVGGWMLLDLVYPCLGCYCFSGGFVWFERSFNGVVVVGSFEVLIVVVVVTYGGVLLVFW